jgi:organic radical activating enzyme
MQHLMLATYPIINSCNLSCPWCAAHLSSQPIFSTRFVLGALDRAVEKYGTLHGVALTGGEPFTSPKILDVKAELEAAGHRVFAITNGTLHDRIWNFLTGDTLDIAMSVHNPILFPEEVNAKKDLLVKECRDRKVKMAAALFSVESKQDVKASLDYLQLHKEAFHTATISTVYKEGVPAIPMTDLVEWVFDCRPESVARFVHPEKVVIDISGFILCLRRSPTREEYFAAEDHVPGCLFLSWRGEFMPVALAQYDNEEALA